MGRYLFACIGWVLALLPASAVRSQALVEQLLPQLRAGGTGVASRRAAQRFVTQHADRIVGVAFLDSKGKVLWAHPRGDVLQGARLLVGPPGRETFDPRWTWQAWRVTRPPSPHAWGALTVLEVRQPGRRTSFRLAAIERSRQPKSPGPGLSMQGAAETAGRSGGRSVGGADPAWPSSLAPEGDVGAVEDPRTCRWRCDLRDILLLQALLWAMPTPRAALRDLQQSEAARRSSGRAYDYREHVARLLQERAKHRTARQVDFTLSPKLYQARVPRLTLRNVTFDQLLAALARSAGARVRKEGTLYLFTERAG